jgi:hypothetical protein
MRKAVFEHPYSLDATQDNIPSLRQLIGLELSRFDLYRSSSSVSVPSATKTHITDPTRAEPSMSILRPSAGPESRPSMHRTLTFSGSVSVRQLVDGSEYKDRSPQLLRAPPLSPPRATTRSQARKLPPEPSPTHPPESIPTPALPSPRVMRSHAKNVPLESSPTRKVERKLKRAPETVEPIPRSGTSKR